MKKFFALAISLSILFSLAACASGVEEAVPVTPTPMPTATPVPEPTPQSTYESAVPLPEAKELTDSLWLYDNIGGATDYLLYDPDVRTHIDYYWGTVLHIEAPEEISFLYLVWYTPPMECTLDLGGQYQSGGTYGFLQEFIPLDVAVTSLDILFDGYAQLAQVRAFGVGSPPADVPRWEPPCAQADVLVFPAHSDDDVIFFGALIAECVERGLSVEVCYLTGHYDWQPRPQEQLNGLWALGVKNYPIIGPFEDLYVLTPESAYESYDLDSITAYQVEQLRRFRPSVVFGHDREGEYGHGAHQLYSQALERAVPAAADANAYPYSASLWGVWDTPKLYLHAAEENPLLLDAETPLAAFGDRTAFQVAQQAMLCHETQLQYPHRPQLASEEFPRYDCRAFGLVRSLVGADTKNDFMEHIG